MTRFTMNFVRARFFPDSQRSGRFPMRIVMVLCLGLFSRCNSHASFVEEDLPVCGDNRLSPGEDCDNVDGADKFPAGTSCESTGHGTGIIGCKTDCTIDWAGCSQTIACDPLGAGSCDTGLSCYFSPDGSSTGCQGTGTSAEGQSCVNSSDCKASMHCRDNVCRWLCRSIGDLCATQDPLVCSDAGLPDGYGVCLGDGACDPVNDLGCVNESCYLVYDFIDGFTGQCRPAGSNPVGWPCGEGLECMPTLYCQENVCRPLCRNLDTPCGMDELGTCTGAELTDTIGLCVEGADCDPVFNAGCPYGGCSLLEGSTQTTCRVGNDSSTGTICAYNIDCAPGNLCAWTYDDKDRCTRLCRNDAPCGFEMICAFSSSLDSSSMGLCVPDAQGTCDPLTQVGCPGSTRCFIVNSEGDRSCLMPGPIQESALCDLNFPCTQGLYCAMELDRKCHRVCDSDYPCTGNLTCDFQAPWHTAGRDMGFCI